jgi:hypothetical protein
MSVETGRETGYIERGGRTGRFRFCTAPDSCSTSNKSVG